MQSKKHPQFILGIDNAYFASVPRGNSVCDMFRDGLNPFPAEWFLREAQSYIVIRERDWLDNQVKDKWQHRAGDKPFKGDPTYRQILPYCVIRIALPNGEWQYFLYRREDTVGEARLAGNVSAGYGGHIDLVDVVFNAKSVIALAATIRLSSRREIFGEETVIYDADNNVVDPATLEVTFTDQFITQETEVESLHVGIVMSLDLPVGYRVETPENELTSMDPMTARQLLASGLPIEHWTRAIMEADVATQEHNKKMLDALPDTSNLEETDVRRIAAELKAKAAAENVNARMLENLEHIFNMSDTIARIRLIEKAAQVGCELVVKALEGNDESMVLVDGELKPRPYLAMLYSSPSNCLHFGIDTLQPEPTKEFFSFTDENGVEVILTEDESKIYRQLISDKLKAVGLTIVGNSIGANGENLVAVTNEDIPIKWEDVKGLSLTLGGEDANIAAFNEMTTGDPTMPPSPEQVSAYQDKLGASLEENVDTLMTGLAEAPRVDDNPTYLAAIMKTMQEQGEWKSGNKTED